MKIFLVEDDESIRELVVYTLNSSGYEARGFADGDSLHKALSQELPDLFLLDIMLPGGRDGMSLLAGIRENESTRTIPVIMLTAKGTEYDKVIGLDSGADDYVTKPFGMMELVSRVRAVLRRCSPAKASARTLSYGGITLDPTRHSVYVEENEVPLTIKEFQMLELFLENPGMVFTRELLLERVWDYSFDGETRTVDVHIRSLRKKLAPLGDLVETVRGVGYRIGIA
ncbi:response regulator transcription factor [Oscillospiraceae bacterium MB08-C2-2]|nr:response regulator transcription factor [Oscillospiraceae bacterium MB08-C2-2]